MTILDLKIMITKLRVKRTRNRTLSHQVMDVVLRRRYRSYANVALRILT